MYKAGPCEREGDVAVVELGHGIEVVAALKHRLGPDIEHDYVGVPFEDVAAVAEFVADEPAADVRRRMPGDERVVQTHHVERRKSRPVGQTSGRRDSDERLLARERRLQQQSEGASVPLPALGSRPLALFVRELAARVTWQRQRHNKGDAGDERQPPVAPNARRERMEPFGERERSDDDERDQCRYAGKMSPPMNTT